MIDESPGNNPVEGGSSGRIRHEVFCVSANGEVGGSRSWCQRDRRRMAVKGSVLYNVKFGGSLYSRFIRLLC